MRLDMWSGLTLLLATWLTLDLREGHYLLSGWGGLLIDCDVTTVTL